MIKNLTTVFVTSLTLLTASAFAETYSIDPSQSTAHWTASKKTGSSHDGAVAVKSGQVEVTKGAVTGGSLVIDMKSITNKDLEGKPEYQTKLVDHLKSNDFFDVEKFPESTFQLKSVELQKDKTHLVKGTLTMIGKTESIEFPANLQIGKDKVSGDAKIKIDRTKWGLKYGSGNFFKELTADKIINDEFEIAFKFVAAKKK